MAQKCRVLVELFSVPGYLSHERDRKEKGEAGDVWRAILMCRCSCRVMEHCVERKKFRETVGSRQFVCEVRIWVSGKAVPVMKL